MNLERFILNVLDALQPDDMVSDAVVTGSLPAGLDPTPDDVRRTLKALSAKRQAVGITTEDGTLWKITANGKARVA